MAQNHRTDLLYTDHVRCHRRHQHLIALHDDIDASSAFQRGGNAQYYSRIIRVCVTIRLC